MEQMTIDGATIAWADTGEGDATLLIHAGVFGAWFAPLAEHLPGRVIRMLRAGYTDSPPPPRLISLAQHTAHAAALLDALGTGPVTVVGHSSSSVIALQLAHDRPDLVRRLVLGEPPLIDPLLDPADVDEVHRALGPAIGAAMAATAQGDGRGAFDAFMGAVCGPDFRTVVADVLGPEARDRAEREALFFCSNELPATGGWTPVDPAAIRMPVLLVEGSRSPAATHHVTARLAGMLPDARVARIEGTNHLLPLTHPAELAELVTRGNVALSR
jgi:pimeloyl-ACP methyl ester carboxylesterase